MYAELINSRNTEVKYQTIDLQCPQKNLSKIYKIILRPISIFENL